MITATLRTVKTARNKKETETRVVTLCPDCDGTGLERDNRSNENPNAATDLCATCGGLGWIFAGLKSAQVIGSTRPTAWCPLKVSRANATRPRWKSEPKMRTAWPGTGPIAACAHRSG